MLLVPRVHDLAVHGHAHPDLDSPELNRRANEIADFDFAEAHTVADQRPGFFSRAVCNGACPAIGLRLHGAVG